MPDDLYPFAVDAHHIEPYLPVEAVVAFQVKKGGFDHVLSLSYINGMKGISKSQCIPLFYLYKHQVIFFFSDNIYLAEAGPVIPLYDSVPFLL